MIQKVKLKKIVIRSALTLTQQKVNRKNCLLKEYNPYHTGKIIFLKVFVYLKQL